MSNIETWPKKIYLQGSDDVDGDCDKYEDVYQFLESITWCEDSMNEHDIGYVRNDIHEKTKQELKEAMDLLTELQQQLETLKG